MKLNIKKTIIITFILLAFCVNNIQAKCGCNIDEIDNSQLEPGFAVSTNNEIIEGEDYEKLIKINNLILLQKLVSINPGTDKIGYTCPTGYDAPTLEQLEQIKENATYQQLVDSGVFTTDVNYISQTRTDEEWKFHSIKLDTETQEIILGPAHSYFASDNSFVACILQFPVQNGDISQYINGLEDVDQVECTERELSINTSANIDSFEWIFMDGTKSTEETVQLRADKYENETCGKFEFKVEKFGGIQQHFCYVYYTQPYINTADTSNMITQFSDFTATKLDNVSASRYDSKHFSSGSVPIAPKYDNGSYVMYEEPKEDATGDIKVVELDKDNNIIEIYETGKKGRPYDIVAAKFGFVFMARDEPHHLYITAYDVSEKKIKWNKTLINNGEEPNENTELDQIDLGDAFGTTVMFNPHNGRLVNARERIFAMFAHYNFFGYYDDDSRNVHTGDSSVFLDLETGEKTGNAFTWSISHSLYQQVLYDGKTIFTQALGDALPQSIKTHAISGLEGFQDDIVDNGAQVIEPDFLPGNGSGMAAGRIGGLIQIDDDKYIQVHSQRPATSTYGDKGSSTENKLAFTYFDGNLEFESEVVLKPGNLIQTIKTAKYGDHIIVAYTTIPDPGQDFFQAKIKDTDSMHVLLVDFDGNIVQDFDVSESSVLSAADDWEILTDGSVIFSFVNSETNELTIYKTDALVDTNSDDIASQCSSETFINDFVDPSGGDDDDDDDDDNEKGDNNSQILSVGFLMIFIFVFALY